MSSVPARDNSLHWEFTASNYILSPECCPRWYSASGPRAAIGVHGVGTLGLIRHSDPSVFVFVFAPPCLSVWDIAIKIQTTYLKSVELIQTEQPHVKHIHIHDPLIIPNIFLLTYLQTCICSSSTNNCLVHQSATPTQIHQKGELKRMPCLFQFVPFRNCNPNIKEKAWHRCISALMSPFLSNYRLDVEALWTTDSLLFTTV